MRTAVSAAIIEKGNIVLVKKRAHWILPGGKPENGEQDLECLCREVAEELSNTRIKEIEFYGRFIGRTPNTGDILLNRVYLAKLDGGIYAPSKEISGVAVTIYPEMHNLSEITAKVISSLKRDRYII